ncbi:MAG: 3'-5' exonuclease [Spirochaetales bacterium]|nr:3'-5' exonuclease [Spirochaetales bacterium]
MKLTGKNEGYPEKSMPQIRDYKNLDRNRSVFLAIDVETTGLDPFTNRIIEIACIKYLNGKKTDGFSTLVFPEVPIPEDAARISGITEEMVKGSPLFSEIAGTLLEFLGTGILVAHNALFDIGFINNSLARSGFSFLEHDYIDTIDMAHKAFPGKKSYALQALAAELNIPVNAAHRAGDDARVCMDLFFRCDEIFNPGGQISLF